MTTFAGVAGQSRWNAVTTGRHETPRPRWRRIRRAQAAERADERRESGPAQPAEFAILEPADDGLIHAAQLLELALGDPELAAALADELTDASETPERQLVHGGGVEGVPGHDQTVIDRDYPPVTGRSARPGAQRAARTGAQREVPRLMQLECIARPGNGSVIPKLAGAAPAVPAVRFMHPSYITKQGLRPPRFGASGLHRPGLRANEPLVNGQRRTPAGAA